MKAESQQQPKPQAAPVVPPLRISIGQALAIVGGSRGQLYKDISSGVFRTFKQGKRRWTTIEFCQQYVQRFVADHEARADGCRSLGQFCHGPLSSVHFRRCSRVGNDL